MLRGLALGLLAAAVTLPALLPTTTAVAAERTRERVAYVLFHAGERGSMMSGDTDDLRRARAQRAGTEALLYVRSGGSHYVIREAATLRAAERIFAPQRDLGARQGALGKRQGALGAQQAELSMRQAEIGMRQARAAVSLASTGAARPDVNEREQRALEQKQEALGRQQDMLSREQDALSREQTRIAAQTDRELRALIEEAVRSGAARRIG
ncbi:hypothetical protein [Allosphingosinicella indica]|nr:hypothetical protein [Allosphingosinicella indica]